MGLFTLCFYLKTKESYDRWVTRRLSGLDIKYLKKNISKCRSHISGSFRRTPRHCAKWLRNSPGERYQRIRICLTGEVETPSFHIRRQAPDVKYPEKMERQPDRIPDVRYPEKVEHRKGDRLCVHGIGTPPSDDTEHALLSGATPSRFPKRTRGVLPYPDSLREKHTTLGIITPRTIAYPIRICCPDHYPILLAFRICLWQRTSKLWFFVFLSFPLLCHGFQITLLNLVLLW